MPYTGFTPALDSAAVTIANGTSLSAAVDLLGASLVAIVMPAAWTAAGMTFQASIDGVNFFNVYTSAGAEYSATVAASQYVTLPIVDLAGVRWLKVRSGTSGTPVNQGADRALKLVVRPVR